MAHIDPPPPELLPPTRRLNKLAAIAAAGIVLLATVAVMPAERGVDPTGLGRIIGLTQVGELKVALAKEIADEAAAEAEGRAADSIAALAKTSAALPASGTARASTRTDTVRLGLAPNEGKEVKLVMAKGARVTFRWTTDEGKVNYTTHGDTLHAPAGTFHKYGDGSKSADSGEIVAVFDGLHGWFWRNRSNRSVLITLITSGEYREVREMK